MGFLYFHWSPNIILLSNYIFLFALSMVYSKLWKYRFLISVAVLAVNLICEDWAYRLLFSLEIDHILILGTAISNLIFLLILLIVQKIVSLKKGENINFVEWIAMILIPGISIFVSVVVLDKCVNEIAITTGSMCLLVLNFLFFYLLNHIIKMRENQMILSLLKQQNETYESQLQILVSSEEKISLLRHDIKNHFFIIQQMVQNENKKELMEYLNQLHLLIENDKQLIATGNFVIDSFVNMKLGKIKNDIDVELDIDVSISKNLPIEKMDLSIIFGNLLDNAIRALYGCQNQKNLKLILKENQNTVYLCIENTHNEKIKRIGYHFRSTKKNKEIHGIGLQNVKRVVEKYNGSIDINYNENIFCVKLIMYL